MKKETIIPITCALLGTILCLFIVHWGVPTQKRVTLNYGTKENIKQTFAEIRGETVAHSMTRKRPLPTIAFNPIRTYGPDESNFVKALAGIRSGDLNPHYFWYGTIYFIPLGVIYFFGEISGLLTVTSNLQFYLFNPHEMARIYIVGRLISIISLGISIYILFKISNKYFSWVTSTFGSLFYAFSLLPVVFAPRLGTDHLAIVFLLLFLDRLSEISRDNSIEWNTIWAGILLGITANTKYVMGLSGLLIPFAELYRNWNKSITKQINLSFKRLLYSGGISLGVFFITNPYTLIAPKEMWGTVYSLLQSGQTAGRNTWESIHFYSEQAIWAISLPLIILFILSIYRAIVRWSPFDVIHVSWILLAFIYFSIIADKEHGHYLLPLYPSACILAASLFDGKTPDFNLGKILNISILVLIGGYVLIRTFTYIQPIMTQHNPRTTIGSWVKKNIPAGESIGIFDSEYQYTSPPINVKQHPVIRLRDEPSHSPDWVIIPKIKLRRTAPDSRLHHRYQRIKKHYNLVLKFSPQPTIPYLGQADLPGPWSPYYRYYPDFEIYRKSY